MDTARILVTVAGVALICLTLWFFFGDSDETPAQNAKQAASGPIYACPMHPWITSTDPAANCSICGMKLVRQDSPTDRKAVALAHHENKPQ